MNGRTKLRIGGVMVILAGVIACAKKSEDQPSPVATSSGAAGSASAAPSATDAPATPAMAATATLGLFERLAKEKSSRPSGTPRAEAVIAAISKAGYPLADENQVYGATVKASYCEAAKGTNVFVSICEYPDEAQAKAGRDFSNTAFAAVKNRQIFVNKKTTLTVAQSTPTPSGDADTKKIAEVFSKL